jgi:methyl acetate hydrolase
MEARLNAAFSKAVEEKKLPAVGAIVLDRNGKTLYKAAFGTLNASDPNAAPFTTSTQTIAHSLTKLVTSVATLQLIEQGKLKLNDPVEKYVPGIAENKVLLGWNDDGSPNLQEPKTKPTILNLLTHTSGLTYDYANADTLRYHVYKGITPLGYNSGEPEPFFNSPFAFHPGTAHEYGINMDFLGFTIEKVSGKRLAEYFKEYIFDPLGMKDSAAPYQLPADTKANKALLIHVRGADGTLMADKSLFVSPTDPSKIFAGGHMLYSTLEDYTEKFLLTILNKGTHPVTGAKILEKETVEEYLFKEKIISEVHAPTAGVGVATSCVPPASNVGELLPGLKKSWSCGLMMNLEDSPIGRPAGSVGWCGFGNLYYWIDPVSGKTAMFATQLLPFMDETALGLADELERAVYSHPPAKEGERRNFVCSPA